MIRFENQQICNSGITYNLIGTFTNLPNKRNRKRKHQQFGFEEEDRSFKEEDRFDFIKI